MKLTKTKTYQDVWDYYENRPELYDEISKREDSENLLLKTILDDTSFNGKIVLDIGTGTGRFSIPLAKESKFIYALDVSVGLLKILTKKIKQKNIRNIKVLNATYSKIPLPDESVDLIISTWSFPAHSKSWEEDFEEITRVLKKDGKIILAETSTDGELQLILKNVFNESLEKTIKREEWLKKNGFRKQKNLEVRMDFGSEKGVRELGGFWGPHIVEYLLEKGKTSVGVGMSIFYFEK
jgi:ubiquinone/menaquinone biosynthesis C-methylase UbiE